MKSEIIALKEPRGGGASTRLFFSIFGELVVFWFLDFLCKISLRCGGCPTPAWARGRTLCRFSTALDHACVRGALNQQALALAS